MSTDTCILCRAEFATREKLVEHLDRHLELAQLGIVDPQIVAAWNLKEEQSA